MLTADQQRRSKAFSRQLRMRELRHVIGELENEAEASEQHARDLLDDVLNLRGELWELEVEPE